MIPKYVAFAPSVVDVMSGAGDAPAAAGGEDGEEEHATSGEAAAIGEEGATITATRRDSQVAAITFWGALKIPVSASDVSIT